MKITVEIELGDNETPLAVAQVIENIVLDTFSKTRYLLNENDILEGKPRLIQVVEITK